MRIEGYLDHPEMKITVMKMNNRFTVKFEKAGMEQSYKYNESDTMSGLNDIKLMVDDNFQKEVLSIFSRMQSLKSKSFSPVIQKDADDFPHII